MILTMRNGSKIYVNPQQIAMIEQAEVTKEGQVVYGVELSSGRMFGCADPQLAAYLDWKSIETIVTGTDQAGDEETKTAPTVWDRIKGSI